MRRAISAFFNSCMKKVACMILLTFRETVWVWEGFRDFRSNLRSFHLQFVYREGIPLQATGTDRHELFEGLDVLLRFENGFRGHPTDLLLHLLLFLDKLPVERHQDKY